MYPFATSSQLLVVQSLQQNWHTVMLHRRKKLQWSYIYLRFDRLPLTVRKVHANAQQIGTHPIRLHPDNMQGILACIIVHLPRIRRNTKKGHKQTKNTVIHPITANLGLGTYPASIAFQNGNNKRHPYAVIFVTILHSSNHASVVLQ